jgi:hypothetical protein
MSLQWIDVRDLTPPAEAIFTKLRRFLGGFGRSNGGASLVIVRTQADDAISELRLAMFLRDEAEAGSIKASRLIGVGGARAAAARMSTAFSTRESLGPFPLSADQASGPSVVVATRNAGDVIKAAADFGLLAQRMARWDTRRALGLTQSRRRRMRPSISAWPMQDRSSPTPP